LILVILFLLFFCPLFIFSQMALNRAAAVRLQEAAADGSLNHHKNLRPFMNDNTSQFYDGIWSRGLARGKKDFGDTKNSLLFLESQGVLQPEHAILDVGCGIGNLCGALRERGFRNIQGVDISSVAIEAARKKYPGITFRVSEAGALPVAENSMDACISFDVAEHVRDINGYFSETYRVLKNGGVFFFQTPNRWINRIAETVRWQGFGWRAHHPSLQSRRSLLKNLNRAGFSTVTLIRHTPVSEFTLNRIPRWLRPLVKMIPWTKIPWLFQPHFWGAAIK